MFDVNQPGFIIVNDQLCYRLAKACYETAKAQYPTATSQSVAFSNYLYNVFGGTANGGLTLVARVLRKQGTSWPALAQALAERFDEEAQLPTPWLVSARAVTVTPPPPKHKPRKLELGPDEELLT